MCNLCVLCVLCFINVCLYVDYILSNCLVG
nr:MAG TPA: hypothetical protein [Caudoviricetes sp.]